MQGGRREKRHGRPALERCDADSVAVAARMSPGPAPPGAFQRLLSWAVHASNTRCRLLASASTRPALSSRSKMLQAGLLGLPPALPAAACALLPVVARLGRRGASTAAAAGAAAGAADAAADAAAAFAASAKMVSMEINGQQVAVPEGSSILTAANQLRIHVSGSLGGPCLRRGAVTDSIRTRSSRVPLHTHRSPRSALIRGCPQPLAHAACAWWRCPAER